MKKIYIGIEGPNGAGKSTVAKNLANALQKKHVIKSVCEPFYTKMPKEEREKTSKIAQALNFQAQRIRLFENEILGHDGIIISDRNYISTLVYQQCDDLDVDVDILRKTMKYPLRDFDCVVTFVLMTAADEISLNKALRRYRLPIDCKPGPQRRHAENEAKTLIDGVKIELANYNRVIADWHPYLSKNEVLIGIAPERNCEPHIKIIDTLKHLNAL